MKNLFKNKRNILIMMFALLEKINFNMEKENTVIKYYYSVDDEATWNEVTKASENSYDVDLLANTTDEFQVKVEYDPTKTGIATEEQKSNKLTLNLDYAQKTGGGTVVPSETITIDELKENAVTTGDGLYDDTTELGRYIYRGANPSNYITFNEETDGEAGWRILSVESDGTLKIIKKESVSEEQYDTENGRFSDSGYCNHSGNGCKVWGSNSTMLDVNGNNITEMPREIGGTTYALPSEESSLNVYLNREWYNTLSKDVKSMIIYHTWNVGLLNHQNGQTLETDVSQEKAYKWKGNVGLMSATDYVKTSTNSSCKNAYTYYNSSACYGNSKNHNWLFNGNGQWTMTPTSGSVASIVRAVNGWYPVGMLGSGGAYPTNNIYPAIYVDSNITLSGKGTIDEPYTINS